MASRVLPNWPHAIPECGAKPKAKMAGVTLATAASQQSSANSVNWPTTVAAPSAAPQPASP